MSPKTMVHQHPLKDLIMLMHKTDSNYEEIDRGFLNFEGNVKGGKITGKDKIKTDFKLTDESHVLLKVPRKDNMYNVDLKNVVSQVGIENLIDLKVKVIRCDNGTEFKNRVMNQFYEMKVSCYNLEYHRSPRREKKKDAKDLCNEDSEVPSTEELRVNKENDANVSSTNNINTVSPTDNAAGIKVNVIDENIVYEYVDDPNMPDLEEIGRFSDVENDDLGDDINNLDKYFQDFVVYQMDVKSVFLYGKIKEEVYVFQPLGFEDPNFPDKVYKVEKALYGFHQAPRAWKEMCIDFEKMMHRKFQINSIGELTFFLGLQVKQKEDGIFISQDNMCLWKIPRDCQLLRCRLISWQFKKQTVVVNSTMKAKEGFLEWNGKAAQDEISTSAHNLNVYVVNTAKVKNINGEAQLHAKYGEEFGYCYQIFNVSKEIANLKKRVKRLERKRKSRSHRLKRLYKVGLSEKVESSADEESLGEDDSSKQGRISDIDANQDIYLVNVHRDEDIFGVNDQDDTFMFDADKDLQGEEVVVEEVNAFSIKTHVGAAATTTTTATTPTIYMDEITLAKALIKIKTSRPKAKGLVMQERSETPTPTPIVSSKQPSKVQDKGDFVRSYLVNDSLDYKRSPLVRIPHNLWVKHLNKVSLIVSLDLSNMTITLQAKALDPSFGIQQVVSELVEELGSKIIHQYLQHEHYALWEVIEFGDSYKAPPEETVKDKGLAVRFSKYDSAKELWETILKTFGGNEATKKTKKNQLKQQYGNFKAEGSETLKQTFNRLQAIVSHLEFMDVPIEQDDLNQKFLTSLAPEWLVYTIVWRNIDDQDTMSLDDVYNHLKVYEPEDWSYMAEEDEASMNHALVADEEEVPTEYALMAKSSSISDNEVYDDSFCSKSCRKNIENLNTKISKLNEELSDCETHLYNYKRGLSQVKARLVEFKENEIKYYEKIRVLERERESLKIIKLNISRMNLRRLLGSQKLDKDKKGVGFNEYCVVPPPSAQVYSPPMKDLSWMGLPKFVDDIVTDYAGKPTVKYAEMYRNTSQSPRVRGNQKNWNNKKS
nr:ribonuclease H-like domain-containing protein [Tanacetum cinerariifolium]